MDAAGGTSAVAKRLGVSPETVRKWARPGATVPAERLASLKRLAKRAPAVSAPPARPVAPATVPGGGDDPLDGGDTPEPPATPERPRGLTRSDPPTTAGNAGGGRGNASGPTLGGVWPFGRGGNSQQGQRQQGSAPAVAPLSRSEAGELRDGLVRFIQAMGEYTDEGIAYTNKKRAKPEIWSTLDDEEAGTLADLLIARGLRSGPAAQVVRNMSRAWQLFAVGAILLPRFRQTVRFYAENGGFGI